MDSLEMLANNVANSSTIAFKSDREFYGVYSSEQAASGAVDPTLSPVVEKSWTDFAQGTLLPTGNQLDLAIAGRGFFITDASSGPLYTRSGNFKIAADGQIETQEGYKVRVKTPDNQKLRLDALKPVDISNDGVIRQEGRDLGRFQMVDFDNSNIVSKRGSTYFQVGGTDALKAVAPDVRQGSVESSNVPVAESAVRLVSVMRQFEMLQRAMAIGGEMNRRSVDEVAKVG